MLLIIGYIKLIKERHQNNITSKAGGPWGKKSDFFTENFSKSKFFERMKYLK